jgi:hypothetical protein
VTLSDIAKWELIAIMVLGSLLSIGYIGKPRKPATPGSAIITIVMNGLFGAAIIIYWH